MPTESIVLDSYERQLVCDLSDDEVQERAQRAADKQADIQRLTDERDSHMKELAGQIKSLEGGRNELLRQVRLKQDLKFVGVEKRLNPAERSVITVRLDTGEQIDIRAAREDELQIHLLPYSKKDGKGNGGGAQEDGDGDEQRVSGDQ